MKHTLSLYHIKSLSKECTPQPLAEETLTIIVWRAHLFTKNLHLLPNTPLPHSITKCETESNKKLTKGGGKNTSKKRENGEGNKTHHHSSNQHSTDRQRKLTKRSEVPGITEPNQRSKGRPLYGTPRYPVSSSWLDFRQYFSSYFLYPPPSFHISP